jgi:hypothetical protein
VARICVAAIYSREQENIVRARARSRESRELTAAHMARGRAFLVPGAFVSVSDNASVTYSPGLTCYYLFCG